MNGRWKLLPALSVRFWRLDLATEVASGFTGLIMTMYVFVDNGTIPALFDWFDYEVIRCRTE